jgi:uncharacterized protein (DUF1810 family)
MDPDPFDLDRFLQAQARQYASALDELRQGSKRSHWIWFVFPQLQALGRSGTAQFYGLRGLDEAAAYWQHPTLGARLRDCTQALLDVPGRPADEILGELDAMKLRSCLTLFLAVAPQDALLGAALQRFFGGQPDPLTVALLAGAAGGRAPGA